MKVSVTDQETVIREQPLKIKFTTLAIGFEKNYKQIILRHATILMYIKSNTTWLNIGLFFLFCCTDTTSPVVQVSFNPRKIFYFY